MPIFHHLKSIFLLFAVALLLPLPSLAQGQKGSPEKPTAMVAFDFDNVDIQVFVKYISKITGRNFVLDHRVKGKVTVVSPTKIPLKDAVEVFDSVLEINGFALVPAGRVTKIIPVPHARAENIDTKISKGGEKPGDNLVTRLIPLEYADANALKKLLIPLVPKQNLILSYDDTNMLIVTASQSRIKRLLKIIRVIDVPNVGKSISVIPVYHADATKLVKTLTSIFTARTKAEKGKQVGQTIHFTAEERTNSVVVLASKAETERVRRLIHLLDQQIPKGGERIRVYYLEHAAAEDMVKVLQQIPTQTGKAKSQGKKEAPLLSTKVHINADKTTNSLIIMAEKEDYPVLEDVIQKLDIPRAMVYIECLIMEVNVNRGLNVGTEWKISQDFDGGNKLAIGGFGGTGDSGYESLSGLNKNSAMPKGFSLGVLGESFTIGGITFPNIQAVVDALSTDKDVNILATPQLLTTENEEAVISVGKNVPYQTRSAAETATQTYSSYEYKDVGISLKITPRISKDRMVRLDVFQELTKLDTLNQTSPDRPTTYKRQIETTIIVEDSHSVVIGGLIDETSSETESKAPCLGDIPILGWAFKSLSHGHEKSNLYVFLTPHVVKDSWEASQLYETKHNEIRNQFNQGEIPLSGKVIESPPLELEQPAGQNIPKG